MVINIKSTTIESVLTVCASADWIHTISIAPRWREGEHRCLVEVISSRPVSHVSVPGALKFSAFTNFTSVSLTAETISSSKQNPTDCKIHSNREITMDSIKQVKHSFWVVNRFTRENEMLIRDLSLSYEWNTQRVGAN